jgi:hypothetical protein
MAQGRTRTIVFSDVHGEPGIIAAVVGHSGFDPDVDRLVFAGDAIEVGRESSGCLDALDALGAECLVGNHEYGAFVGRPIEGAPLDRALVRRVTEYITSRRWRLAAAASGVLITHAGVGQRFFPGLGTGGASGAVVDAVSAERIAQVLNEEFKTAVADGSRSMEGVVGAGGPLWWRPGRYGDPLAGVTQVIGHTPPESIGESDAAGHWARRGVYLIDPWVRGWRRRDFRPPTPVRYAVIEDGAVRRIDA